MNLKNYLVIFITIFSFLRVDVATAQASCNGLGSTNILPTKCFEIESILVNACSNNEGFDEMVRLRVGPNSLTLSSINFVDWPTTNSWLGWATYNSTTLSKLATINNLIANAGNCGKLIKLNPTDVAPPYARVLIITSTVFSTTAHDFSGLTDTLYVALQNNSTNSNGHFTNTTTNTPRTLIVRAGSCGDTVTHYGNFMVKENGSAGSEDGSGVNFAHNGTATYYNYGCALPINPFSVDAGTTGGPFCSGASVPLQGLVSGTACYYWYPQQRNAGNFTDSTNLVTQFNVAPSYSGTVKLYLRANGSCTTKLDSIQFTVSASFTNIDINAVADSVICNKNTFTLTATSGSSNPVVWRTSANGSFTNLSGLSTTYVPSITDTGYVWLSVSQNLNCGSTKDSVKVYFTPPPNANFNITDTLFCLSQAGISIALNPIQGGGTFSGIGVSGQSFIVPSSIGVFSIKHVITKNGCSDSVTKYVVVEVGLNARFSLSDSVVCLGDKNIIVTPVQKGGFFSGASLVGDTFIPTNSGTYNLTYVLDNGTCTDTFSRQIVVLPKPNANFSLSDSVVCSGKTVALSATENGGVFSGLNMIGNIFSTTVAGTYPLKHIINKNGCSDSMQKNVVVLNKPSAAVNLSDTLICLGSKKIVVVPINRGGVFSGVNLIGDTFTPTSAGFSNLMYITNNGICADTFSKQIVVLPKPNAGFVCSKTIVCGGNEVTFTAAESGGAFIGTHVVGKTFSTLVPGNYEVKYRITQNGCSDSTQKTITVLPLPNADFNLSDTILCIGSDSIYLTPINNGGLFLGDGVNGNMFYKDASGKYAISYVLSNSSCADTVTRFVHVNPKPDARFTISDSVFCEGDLPADINTVSIRGVFYGGKINNNKFIPDSAGNYLLTHVVQQNGCVDSAYKNVIIYAKPKADFAVSPNTLVVDDTAYFTYTGNTPVNNYFWRFGDGNSSTQMSPMHIYKLANTYQVWLKVTNANQCSDSITKNLLVDDIEQVFVPNVFTPNGDGINEEFKISLIGVNQYHIYIYNRWGSMVFESNNIDVSWDGKDHGVVCPEGVYVYVISFISLNGTEKFLHGTVTVLR
jgi:gliding motility-associated-like protein